MQPQADPQPLSTHVTAEVAPAASRQETELWWGGYAVWTMLPSLVVCLLLTAALIGMAAYHSRESAHHGTAARWWAYRLTALLWLVQSVRWIYRVAGYEYRLTSRRLFCVWGPLFTPPPPVALADIKTVHVKQDALERWLDVGAVVIESHRTAVPVLLTGVRNPEHVAHLIREAAEQGREPSPALPVQS